MKSYININKKHIILAQNKTGSSTIEHMFGTLLDWQDIFHGKRIINPKTYLLDYVDTDIILTYKTILLIRNPVDWIISGFRWMCREDKKYNKQRYATNLTDHLMAVKNKIPYNEHWQNHCLYFPMDFYNHGYVIFKLEEFDKFLTYLDQNCDSAYTKLKMYNQNKNNSIPYPKIKNNDRELMLDILSNSLESLHYDIEATINLYQYKYKNGLLQ